MILIFNKQFVTLSLMAIFGLTILSCNTDNKSTNNETMNANDLTLGPVVHDTLNNDQIEKITKIQIAFSEVNPSTLEETISNFKRDQNADNEIAIWLAMARAYEKFMLTHKEIGLDKKKEVYQLILMRSMEDEEAILAKANLTLLNNKEIAEIFSYYNFEAKPIAVIQK
ncbi:hypothetical protein SF1_43630 [Sphingobacterium faecium NBRC 15299]|nr:hypothetical protein C8N37_1192 [Sphingobacterium faecium]GEM66381.1 hypothetical protein SF1_43630 [Sphingobacterium faecium NBRC 15299]